MSCTVAAALPAAGAGDVHGDSNHQDLRHQHERAGTGSIVLDGKVRSAVPNAVVVGHSMPQLGRAEVFTSLIGPHSMLW